MNRHAAWVLALLAASPLPAAPIDAGPRVIDVRAFGARGDGLTDDRVSIQSAIDNAPASGAIIRFPAGVYLLRSFHPSNLNSGILRMKSNLTFAGAGPASEIRLHAGWYAGKAFNVFSNYDAADPARFGRYENIVFRDLLINANGSANRYAGAAGPRVVIQFGDTSGARVERVTFTGINVSNVIGIGRPGRSASGFHVSGCTFVDPTSGDPGNTDHSSIYSYAGDTTISGNRFLNATVRGRIVATAAELHASRSTFAGNAIQSYRQALYLASQEDRLVEDLAVDNNTAVDLNACFATFWGDRDSNVIRGVRIANNSAAINPTRAGSDDTAQFIGTTADGVFSDVAVTRNVASATPGIRTNKRAIGTFTSIAGWSISGNRFSGWDGGGVHVIHVHPGKTATGLGITGNAFVDCATAGPHRIPVYVDVDNVIGVTVAGNTFRSSPPPRYLVYVAAAQSAADYRIDNNTATSDPPTAQDAYVGGPAPPGLPGGVTPASVKGSWTIRGVRVEVPRLAAGASARLSAPVSASEYAGSAAVVTPLAAAADDRYELSNAQFSDRHTLTVTVRNRAAGTAGPGSLTADLRVVYR